MDALTQKTRHTRAWFISGLAVVLLRALPNLRFPIGRDQATYCVIGQGLLRGQLLYRDLWDNKPPAIFYIYALIVKIFGPVMWSVGAVDILWLLLISCCIFFFARRYMGAPAAALAMVCNAIRHCRQGYIHAAQPETFLMLCVFAAYFLLWEKDPSPAFVPQAPSPQERGRKNREVGDPLLKTSSQEERLGRIQWMAWYLAAGLILGCGFWLKYNAVAFFPFVALVPFLDFSEVDGEARRVRLRIPWTAWLARMVVMGGGFLLAVFGLVGYFWIVGAWPGMREVQFEVLPRYAAGVFQWNQGFLFWAIRQSQNHLGVLTEAMAALTILIAWRRRELALVAPALLMGLAGYIAAAMQGRFHPYYFETCYPFFAMYWGYVLVKGYEGFIYLRQVFAARHWTLARAMLWLVVAVLSTSLIPDEGFRVVEQYRLFGDWRRNAEMSYVVYWWQLPLEKLSGQLKVINYLKQHSEPGDEVYVWGTAPLINFLSQRTSPSRFVSNLALISTWGPERWRRELVETLKAKRPRYVVVARHDSIPTVSYTLLDSEQYLQKDYPALQDLLNGQYQIDVDFWDFEVYRLK